MTVDSSDLEVANAVMPPIEDKQLVWRYEADLGETGTNLAGSDSRLHERVEVDAECANQSAELMQQRVEFGGTSAVQAESRRRFDESELGH